MDYFNRSGRDFDKLQRRYNSQDADFNPADWAGFGMQLYGASLQDKAANEELARKLEEEERQRITAAQNARISEQQNIRASQQTDRSQNISALNSLEEQRERALKNRTYSFRKSALKAMGV